MDARRTVREDRAVKRNLLVGFLLVLVAVASFLYAPGRGQQRSTPTATAAAPEAPPGAGLPRPRSAPQAHRRTLRWSSGARQAIHVGSARAVPVAADEVGHLEGQVRSSATGAGVARAELSFAAGDELHTTTADEQGRFRFAPPTEGSYELAVVAAEGFLPFAPEWGHSPVIFTATRGNAIAGATIYLAPAADYLGRVVDPTGEPVAGAMVVRLGASPSAQQLVRLPRHFRTDEQGFFHFTAPDYAVLEARRAPWSPGRGVVDWATQLTRAMLIRMGPKQPPAPGQATITGTVTDPQGSGVPDALVVARFEPDRPASPEARLNPGGRAVADETGSFTIYGLDPGRYTVVASASGLAADTRRGVGAPEKQLRLTLGSGGALVGTVRSAAEAAPIPSFAVVVARSVGPLEREVVTAESTFDPAGGYEIPALPEGDYEVTVRAAGFAEADWRAVHVDAGGTSRADFSLDGGGSIAGRVLDATSGQPIGDAAVSVEKQLGLGAGALPLRTSVRTDERGHFRLDGLRPGQVTLLVGAPGHHGKVAARLPVTAGQQTGPVTIELSPTEQDEQPRIELVGIGAVLAIDDDTLVIGQLIDGGGAAAAGLAVGDGIVAVDGVPVTDLGFAGSVDRIRGPEGTTVVLTIRRAAAAEGEDPIQPVVVERTRIRG